MPAAIRWFPESLGLVPRVMPECGMIFRSIPQEVRTGGVVAAPLFALMGSSSGSRPLIVQLWEQGGMHWRDFIQELLIEKIAKTWVDLLFDCGLLLEAHAQDLLFSLSTRMTPLGSVYYRDFEGVAIDWSLRRSLGWEDPKRLPHTEAWFSTYETWGYPLYQSAWMKMRASLIHYMHFVLSELEIALIEMESCGVIKERTVRKGDLTLLFSQSLRKVVQEKFGMQEREEYNVYEQLSRFLKFLMEVRRRAMRPSDC
ncbi:MAG: hypothetical protein ACREVO_09180 [Steroidobacteraceae bacterium]